MVGQAAVKGNTFQFIRVRSVQKHPFQALRCILSIDVMAVIWIIEQPHLVLFAPCNFKPNFQNVTTISGDANGVLDAASHIIDHIGLQTAGFSVQLPCKCDDVLTPSILFCDFFFNSV